MKKVQATGEPVIVTKRGTPIVRVVPVQSEKNEIFGFMKGKVKIVGDIESPIPVEWESMTKCSCSTPTCSFGSPLNQQNCPSLLAPPSEGAAELAELASQRLLSGS